MSLRMTLERSISARWQLLIPVGILGIVLCCSLCAQQPAKESLDLSMYQRIREEGFEHSHVMEYAFGLSDGIGPRLTGSPNLTKAYAWTREQLTNMGCSNVHVEDEGEFGFGWQQRNAWLRMVIPDTSVFTAQAVPWSPPTQGPVTAEAILATVSSDQDFANYHGKLAGKIVVLGEMRPVPLPEEPLAFRWSDNDLARLKEYPVPAKATISAKQREESRAPFADKLAKFMTAEKAVAVVLPSKDGLSGYWPLLGGADGGGTGLIFDDMWHGFGSTVYTEEHALHTPAVIASIESYGRVYRLLKADIPVSLEINVDTGFTGAHEHLADVIGEIQGTDPTLKPELVMLGAHLDSWASGTGAADNGAGSAVALEVMRILTTLKVRPRRTIRVALWSGEEQGLLGSQRYVEKHFGSARNDHAGESDSIKAEQRNVSVYFNVDGGAGKIRGIFTENNIGVIPIFEQWIEPLQDLGVSTVTARHTSGSDHESFDAVGIPGFHFLQDPLDYFSRTHHSNMDTYERLPVADMKQIAVVEAIFVYDAAMRDAMLPALTVDSE
jgi:carboxypeptidase Q